MKSYYLCIYILLSSYLGASTFDFEFLNGNGRFVNAKGGTISSGGVSIFDEVKGRAFVSGDFGDNNYSDIVNTDLVLKGYKFTGRAISSSPLYKAMGYIDPKDNGLKFKLTRIKFTSGVINNKKLATYLEENYSGGSKDKDLFYNSLKDLDSKEDINKTLDSFFGVEWLPLMVKHQFHSIRKINLETLDSISYFDKSQEINEWLANATYNSINHKRNNYKTTGNISNIWIEKKVTLDLKYGFAFSLIESSLEKEDDIQKEYFYRDDTFYSGGTYLVYDKNDVVYTSSLSLGGDHSNLDRYSIKNGNSVHNGSINESYYFGISNSVYKNINISKYIVTPKIQLNSIGLHQEKIKESGSLGVETRKEDNFSLELGIGNGIYRKYRLGIKHQVDFKLEVTEFLETMNKYKYKGLEVKNRGFNSYFKINRYKEDLLKTKVEFKQGYRYSDYLGITFFEDYDFSKNFKEYKYGIKINYMFNLM